MLSWWGDAVKGSPNIQLKLTFEKGGTTHHSLAVKYLITSDRRGDIDHGVGS